ncbi:MAG: ABC transporter ATP-binding protein [Sphingobacteriaceae bacterium]|nr:ABC transporter ATP-binding protein [Sphingobacteriaceae bacterium]
MKTYFKILSFARPLRNFIPRYLLLSLLSIVFGIFNFTLLIPLLNIIFDTVETAPERLAMPEFSLSAGYIKAAFNYYFYDILQAKGKFGALQFVCGVVLFTVLMSNVFRYWSQRVLTGMRTMVVMKLRQALFNRLVSLNVRYFNNQRKGNLISVLSNDVTEIENSVVSSIQTVFREPLLLMGYIILLFTISVKLTFFSFLVLPISGFVIGSISKKLKRASTKGQQQLGSILSIIEETISGIRIIKAFNAQEPVKQKFQTENSSYRQTLKSIFNRKELASPLSEIMGIGVVLSIILYGGQLVISGQSELSASEFITYIILYSQLLPPAKAMTTAMTNLQRGLAAAERVFEVLDTENPIVEAPNALPVSDFKSGIELKGLSFKYGDEWVLRDLQLRIPKGSMVALVGPSGSGKSTLADLIPRFIDPQQGAVLIDGQDVRQLKIKEVRALMGIVTQESILFNDTVTANIAFGVENPDPQLVIEAAKVANAHDFIAALENGYDTVIGDRGARLSGGQRQRLSIARAVFKNPPILILDEATSALDTESEKLVQEALAHLMENRTSIVVAHRLSTIQHADLIVVLEKGEITELGTHEALMQSSGSYRRLIEMQQL